MRSWILATVLLTLAWAAHADWEAVYRTNGGEPLTVQVRDDQHVRFGMGEQGFAVLVDGKPYSVMNQGGQWIAFDMDAMFEAMGQMGRSQGRQDASTMPTLKDTGRTETVAGFKGTVYEVTDQRGRTTEVVMSKAPEVAAATRGFLAFIHRMAAGMGGPGAMDTPIMGDMVGEYGGILRSDDFELVRLEEKNLPDSTYQLPEGTRIQQIPRMPGRQ